MTTKSNKLRNQVKSRFYYLFWGAATLSVFAGQIPVGNSYNRMSKSLNQWFNASIDALIDGYLERKNGGTYTPLVPPPRGDWRDYGDGVVFLEDLDPDDYILWEETK